MSHGQHSCLQADCQAKYAAYPMPSLSRHGQGQCLTARNYQRLGGSNPTVLRIFNVRAQAWDADEPQDHV
jgi:hemoglobin-like flavoprotein